ncbi:MAG TPA: WcaF family extracellular polysaccharide biosynthesis acetyltransferase [Bryobacteraceae bacterium]|jgi:putative colanic acid biosynthesis acetyltransferase WcaF
MPTTGRQTDERARVDLSKPDNTQLVRGRNRLIEALWIFFGAPVLASRVMIWSGVRVFLLRLFGAKAGVNVYIKPGVRVKFPWYLSIGDHCWIGEDVWIDNLAPVSIASHVCVSQGAYLCTGNHDWSMPNMRLFSRPIRLETGSWVGARSVVCPGVTVAEGAVLSVGSVATKDLAPFGIYTGNPAVFVRQRVLKG